VAGDFSQTPQPLDSYTLLLRLKKHRDEGRGKVGKERVVKTIGDIVSISNKVLSIYPGEEKFVIKNQRFLGYFLQRQPNLDLPA
jgi:hypothetical protein